jgi:hypothetical protein
VKKTKAEPSSEQEQTAPEQEVLPPGSATAAPEAPSAVLAIPSDGMTPEFSLELAKRRVNQFNGIVKLIAAEMNPKDLYVFCPRTVKTEEDLLKYKAYLPLHACQSILAWAGAIWMPDKDMIERRDSDELGPFIEYDLWADVMTADSREVRVMGSCSTRHPFHGVAFTFWGCPSCRNTTEWKNGKNTCPQHGTVKARKLNAYRPLCDVNRGNVRKHAVTNTFNKAVDALGFTPTLRDLKEAGMNIQLIPRANFGRDSGDDDDSTTSGGSQGSTSRTPAGATGQRETVSDRAASQPQTSGTGPQTPRQQPPLFSRTGERIPRPAS